MISTMLDATKLNDFVAFVEEGRIAAGLPGMALGITGGDRVLVAQGLGHRAHNGDAKVIVDTVFAVGSVSKSWTTLLMAQLVERKRFDWHTPITQVYPAFRLENSADTAALVMADTVGACVALSPHDIDEAIFSAGSQSGESLIAELQQTRVVAPRGARFAYSNALVAAGGFMAAHAAYPELPVREACEQAMQSHLFAPLGMHATTFRSDTAKNLALPHGLDWDADLYSWSGAKGDDV